MKTLHLGVVGHNISYSKSPLIHSAFAKQAGLPVLYTIEEVGTLSFAQKIAALRKAGFWGCNITVPFKEEAFALATHPTLRAKQAGAANTFLFNPDGIIADNTDGLGLIRDLTYLGFDLQHKRVLICGAGGAVRGILGPLLEAHPTSITIANRSLDKAHILAERFHPAPIDACTYADLADRTFDLIIDGTSLKTEPLPLPETLRLTEGALVYDLKYHNGHATSIMEWAQDHGAKAAEGMGMLIEQAAEAFFLWTGYRPDTQALRETLQ